MTEPISERSPLRITMLLYGEVEHDSRVRREAKTLVECGYRVTIATLAEETRPPFELDGARIVPLRPAYRGLIPGADSPFRGEAPRGKLGRLAGQAQWGFGYAGTFVSWTRKALRRLPPADVWHGHDLLGLIAARQLRRKHGGALVHDSHELFLEAGSAAHLPGPARRLLAWLESGSTRQAQGVITVNASIAEELHRRYGVDPIVVMNCPILEPLPDPASLELRARLGLSGRKVVLYHGALNPGRGVEELVGAVPLLPPDAAVVLLGNGNLLAPYRDLAETPGYRDRLFVHPAVPIAELGRWVADADLGVIAFQPVDRNNVLGTPNKLFEYLEAGVPMVVSDFPEMRRLVTETGSGLAVDTSTSKSLADGIERVLGEPAERLAERKASARRAAEGEYNWQHQSQRLVELYGRLDEARAGAK